MRNFLLSLVAAAALVGLAAPQAAAQSPVLVELFTSQGCSACASANKTVAAASRNRDVLILTYNVDYWDYLGWRDTFARPEFAKRQRTYATQAGKRALPTPQVVVQGAHRIEKLQPDQLTRVLAQPADKAGVRLRSKVSPSGELTVAAEPTSQRVNADVWVAQFEPGPVYVDVARGENAGQRVAHYNVVRRLDRIGGWRGEAARWTLPTCAKACAVIVQDRSGPVLSAISLEQARLTAGRD
jgi:hypothetical protein